MNLPWYDYFFAQVIMSCALTYIKYIELCYLIMDYWDSWSSTYSLIFGISDDVIKYNYAILPQKPQFETKCDIHTLF